ncbi:hypothetical protein ACFHWD_04395 [Clostridium sp. MT-14]|uniref:hypothetical protein n=1 Tax=Clostridium sp. MT-14 TaxID=3348360 RepID=UPI0035F3529D
MSNGNFAGGDGTASNPYLIEDADDLNAVRNNLSASYKLIKDVDLNISPYNEGEGWTPIGDTTNNRFTGVFDGNGHIIKNLFINRTGIAYQGLFGCINNANIQSIKVENVNINTNNNYIGGLIGITQGTSVVSNCCSMGIVKGSTYVGGLVGYSAGTVSNSYTTCTVNGSSSLGGLIGTLNQVTLKNCYSSGVISANAGFGGLIGGTGSVTSTIIHSYWDTNTSGTGTSRGGTGLTTAQMETPSSFVGWDTEVLEDGVTKVWILKDGEYPKLWFEKPHSKFLIKQSNEYYSVQNNTLTKLGTPTDDTQLEQWFNDYGVDDLNTALLTPDANGNKLINSLDDQFQIRMMKFKQ